MQHCRDALPLDGQPAWMKDKTRFAGGTAPTENNVGPPVPDGDGDDDDGDPSVSFLPN